MDCKPSLLFATQAQFFPWKPDWWQLEEETSSSVDVQEDRKWAPCARALCLVPPLVHDFCFGPRFRRTTDCIYQIMCTTRFYRGTSNPQLSGLSLGPQSSAAEPGVQLVICHEHARLTVMLKHMRNIVSMFTIDPCACRELWQQEPSKHLFWAKF